MNTAVSAILWGIPTFSLLVLLHEGGHFAVARAFGVKVHEFMLGLPGPALRYHTKNCAYGVTAIPLGGYVRIAGMEPGPEDPLMVDALRYVTRVGGVNAADLSAALDIDMQRAETLLATLADWDALTVDEHDRDRYLAKADPERADEAQMLLDEVRRHTYRGQSVWKRIAILAAGVVINLAAALAIFVFMLSVVGTPTQSLKLEGVVAGGPAAKAGVVAGDRIESIDGARLADWQALLDTIGKHKPGDTITFTWVHDGTVKRATVTLDKSDRGTARLGIQASLENVRVSLREAFRMSFQWIGMVFQAIGGFFNPRTFQATVSQSSSIVGASVEVSRAAAAGFDYYIWIVALLSLSLGVINVVPIPPLDGGKILLEIVERFMGRPLPRNLTLGLSVAGTMMLFALIGYLMYADVVRYVINGG